MIAKHGSRIHHGASLIDVAVGAAILSLMLIPAMKMMGASSKLIADAGRQDSLLFEAERAMELTKIRLSDQASFDNAVSPVDAAIADNPVDRFRSYVELAADPAINGLLTINATVYQDINNNRQFESSEPHAALRTQWCRP